MPSTEQIQLCITGHETVNPLCERWTDNSGCLKQYSCGQQAIYINCHNGSDARKQAFFGGSWPPDCSTQHRFCTKITQKQSLMCIHLTHVSWFCWRHFMQKYLQQKHCFVSLWNLTSMPFLQATTTSFVLLLPLVMTHMYQTVFSDKREGISVFSTSQPTVSLNHYWLSSGGPYSPNSSKKESNSHQQRVHWYLIQEGHLTLPWF